jgi:amidase
LGLISRGGVVPLLEQYDSPGPIDQNVTDAAAMLNLLTGVDPRDPATERQAGHVPADYTAFLDPNALQGAHIGITEPSHEHPVLEMPGLGQIRATLEASGATVVALHSHVLINNLNPKFFLAQFRAQLDRYLAARGPTSPQHSVAQVVAFNRRGGKRAVQYGQKQFLVALGLPAKVRRRAAAAAARRSVRTARAAMDQALDSHHLDALLVTRGVSALTNTPAGYPAITVPAGYRVRRVAAPPWYANKRRVSEPYGAIFAGRPWSEPKLISYGYAYEQASKAWRSPALLNPRFAAACAG